MKSMLKYFALAAMATTATLAHATTLSGTIGMSANSYTTANITSTGISFTNTNTGMNAGAGTNAESTTYGTGSFGPSGAYAVAANDNVSLPDNILVSSIKSSSPLQIFSFTNGIYSYEFLATSYMQYTGSVPGFAFYGSLLQSTSGGTYAVVNSTSEFDLTNAGGMTNISFSSVNTNPAMNPTPEPNSLILLGTGLISAAGMVMRKRRLV